MHVVIIGHVNCKTVQQNAWEEARKAALLLRYCDCVTREYYICVLHNQFSRFLKVFIFKRIFFSLIIHNFVVYSVVFWAEFTL